MLYIETPPQAQKTLPGASDSGLEVLARQAAGVAGRISLAIGNLRLRQVLRSQSIRDPLTVILSGGTLEAAIKRAELLREDLKHLTVEHAGQILERVTISIGVAAYPGHGSSAEELVRAADRALYRAKEEGRDKVVVK